MSDLRRLSEIKRIAVTGASGQIAYNLLFRLAKGEVFGPQVRLSLHLLDLPQMQEALQGVVMELEDCAFPLLEEIVTGSDPRHVFEGVDLALLVGAKPRGPGMERADLLIENAQIFRDQAQALAAVAQKEVLILVVGNPCNSNAWIIRQFAPQIPSRQIHALTRLDEHRARALLAKKAGVSIQEVSSPIIWGNHSATQVPDFTHTTIQGLPCDEVLDLAWLQGDFFQTVQTRGAQVIKARGKSSAASAANAIIDAAHDLVTPSRPGAVYSSAMLSDGNPYGIAEGLFFSFPCRTDEEGRARIVEGYSWQEFIRSKIALTEEELLSEREQLNSFLQSSL